jgi:NAD(P)-dependent dehydrogenase (short-subunit alcohol dehydrogenase family)
MEQNDAHVAIVTGAGAGIGAACAKALAAEGYRVVVADLVAESAAGTVAEIEGAGGIAVAVQVDIADEERVRAMIGTAITAYGRLDVLHNNAADTAEESIRGDGNIVDLDLAILDRAYAVNLRGTLMCCKFAIPHMVAVGGGAIINTSTTSAMAGDLFLTSYGVTKAGVNALTQYVATQYGKHGIRCNAIVCGLTLTPSVERNLDAEMVAVYENNITAREFAKPEDVADLVVFLAGAPEYLTGGLIQVNGGQLAHAPAYASFLDRGWGVPAPAVPGSA